MTSFGSKIARTLKRWAYGPRVDVVADVECMTLGSAYGGWAFVDRPALRRGTILSCGLGEDASFDVEIAQRFGASVIIVDPTPRAIAHFDAMVARLGQSAQAVYVPGGSQPVTAYDLSGITADRLRLVPKALTNESGVVRFYAPADPASVSHSIINFQHGYSSTTPHIEVPSIDFATLSKEHDLGDVALAKFDIEGAEIAVLPQMLAAGVRPEQVLVEFDELNWPSRRSRSNFDRVHGQLLANGYVPVHFDKRSCVSYLRQIG